MSFGLIGALGIVFGIIGFLKMRNNDSKSYQLQDLLESADGLERELFL